MLRFFREFSITSSRSKVSYQFNMLTYSITGPLSFNYYVESLILVKLIWLFLFVQDLCGPRILENTLLYDIHQPISPTTPKRTQILLGGGNFQRDSLYKRKKNRADQDKARVLSIVLLLLYLRRWQVSGVKKKKKKKKKRTFQKNFTEERRNKCGM